MDKGGEFFELTQLRFTLCVLKGFGGIGRSVERRRKALTFHLVRVEEQRGQGGATLPPLHSKERPDGIISHGGFRPLRYLYRPFLKDL
jgi:hypothetical protein